MGGNERNRNNCTADLNPIVLEASNTQIIVFAAASISSLVAFSLVLLLALLLTFMSHDFIVSCRWSVTSQLLLSYILQKKSGNLSNCWFHLIPLGERAVNHN